MYHVSVWACPYNTNKVCTATTTINLTLLRIILIALLLRRLDFGGDLIQVLVEGGGGVYLLLIRVTLFVVRGTALVAREALRSR